ncbi:diguanylate cyclase [Methylocella silvestris BL2]|uniref:Diguanylate cyclase n=2 Tax=Methylocella silvestris TaxID=199596 RepID=B8EM51_METSB|nr:diguanylate cyclase [Methylocella silvestris BL2]
MPWTYIEPVSVTIDHAQSQAMMDSRAHNLNLLDLDSLFAQIAILAPDGRIVSTNMSWDAMASSGNLASKHTNYLSDCETALARGLSHDRPIKEGVAKVLSGRLPAFTDSFSRAWGRRQKIFQVTAIGQHFSSGKGAAIFHTDVTPLQRDPLASVSSRAQFLRRAEHVLDDAKGACLETALMLVELHGIDEVNRTQGRGIGEHVARILAKRLRACIREHDLIARLDGGQFAILFRAGTMATRIVPIICRIEAAVREGVIGVGVPLHATIGVALFPQDGEETRELYSAADQRLR